MVLYWKYSTKHYNEATIQKIAASYNNKLQELIAHCQEQTESIQTPSDYGLNKEITYPELDKFLTQTYNGKPIKEQIESMYRLSGLQQGMLFHGLYDNSGSYIEQVGCDLIKADKRTLIASWASVIKNHSIFGAHFTMTRSISRYRRYSKTVTLPVQKLDYSKLETTGTGVSDKSIRNSRPEQRL